MMGRCRSADDVKQGAVRLPTNPVSRPEKLELSSTQEPKYWEVLCEFRSQGYLTTLAKLARLVRQKFLLWCAKLGDNGGLLTNGFVLRICVVQLLLWYNMDNVSKLIARLLGFKPGSRRPDVTSWRCRIVGWLVENGAVLTLCNLRSLLPHPKPIPTDEETKCTLQEATALGMLCIARNVVISIASNLIAEQVNCGASHRC